MENEDEDDFEIDPASMSPVGLDTHHGIQNSSVIKEFITNITGQCNWFVNHLNFHFKHDNFSSKAW